MKITYVLDDLRRMRIVGNASNFEVAHLMYQSGDTLLLRFVSSCVHYSVWFLVRRTSRQCYSTLALITRFDDSYVEKRTFKTIGSTCHWIKDFIRRY